jgi:hypothetical protein
MLKQTDSTYHERYVPECCLTRCSAVCFRCGPDARVHVILHVNNPVSGNVTEHHLMSAPAPQEDLLSHVYALLLHSNGRCVGWF